MDIEVSHQQRAHSSFSCHQPYAHTDPSRVLLEPNANDLQRIFRFKNTSIHINRAHPYTPTVHEPHPREYLHADNRT